MIEACRKVIAAHGVAYSSDTGYLIAVPIDGEWVTAAAPTLDDAIAYAIESDGREMADDDRKATPHLTMTDAIDQLTEWAGGRMTRIVGATVSSES